MSNQKSQKLVKTIIEYLTSKGELDLLPQVITDLNAYASSQGLVNSAIVTSSSKLSDQDMKIVTKYINDNFGSGLNIIEKVDPSLIAGFTVRVGDEVLDASLVTKLENIRKELV